MKHEIRGLISSTKLLYCLTTSKTSCSSYLTIKIDDWSPQWQLYILQADAAILKFISLLTLSRNSDKGLCFNSSLMWTSYRWPRAMLPINLPNSPLDRHKTAWWSLTCISLDCGTLLMDAIQCEVPGAFLSSASTYASMGSMRIFANVDLFSRRLDGMSGVGAKVKDAIP